MKNRSKVVLSALVAGAVALSSSVQALPSISGTIEFETTGGATVNNANLGSATAFTSVNGPFVQTGAETGSYAPLNGGGTFGGTTFIQNLSFGGNVLGPSPTETLWTVINGGTTYSFTATSVTIAHQDNTFLDLTGNGIAHITGFADTAGTWSITDTTQGGPEVTFSAATTAAPESSTTLVLLGLGLTGLAVFAKVRKQVIA